MIHLSYSIPHLSSLIPLPNHLPTAPIPHRPQRHRNLPSPTPPPRSTNPSTTPSATPPHSPPTHPPSPAPSVSQPSLLLRPPAVAPPLSRLHRLYLWISLLGFRRWACRRLPSLFRYLRWGGGAYWVGMGRFGGRMGWWRFGCWVPLTPRFARWRGDLRWWVGIFSCVRDFVRLVFWYMGVCKHTATTPHKPSHPLPQSSKTPPVPTSPHHPLPKTFSPP